MSYQGFEWHDFLIPLNSLPPGYDINNSFAEWDASNLLSLRIVCNTSNYVAIVAYKTNTVQSNPTITIGAMTSSVVVGTWTLAFPNNTTVSLTSPSGVVSNFTMADSAAFDNPLVAYFGVQANALGNKGQFVDVTRIRIPNQFIDDHFNQDAGLDSLTWNIRAAATNSIWVTGPDSKYWLIWNVPDNDFGLGESTTNLSKPVSPTNYSGGAIFDTRLITTNRWALLSTNHVAKNQKTLYFMLRKNPVPTN